MKHLFILLLLASILFSCAGKNTMFSGYNNAKILSSPDHCLLWLLKFPKVKKLLYSNLIVVHGIM